MTVELLPFFSVNVLHCILIQFNSRSVTPPICYGIPVQNTERIHRTLHSGENKTLDMIVPLVL